MGHTQNNTIGLEYAFKGEVIIVEKHCVLINTSKCISADKSCNVYIVLMNVNGG